MTVEKSHPRTNYDNVIPQNGAPAQQPTTDHAPARFRPLSVADTGTTIGAQSPNTPPFRSSKTLAAQTKVAIPRQRVATAPRYNRRVPRACASCRQRKTKCSGDTPVCRQCRELRATCNYPEGWGERLKKYVYMWLYMLFFLEQYSIVSKLADRLITDKWRLPRRKRKNMRIS
jgi:hypothetical protein